MNKSTKSAFPVITGHQVFSSGMTLRDYFAGKTIAGLLSNEYAFTVKNIARLAYEVADAMIAESEKPSE